MDATTLDRLVQLHQDELRHYLQYLGAEQHTAEDLTQEAFVAAWESRNPPPLVMFEGAVRLRAWLRGIARNLYFTHCRRDRRQPTAVDPERLLELEGAWARRLDRVERWEMIRRHLEDCLEEQPPRGRELIRDRYERELPRSALAKVHGLSEEGIKTALRRIRAALQNCLERRSVRAAE